MDWKLFERAARGEEGTSNEERRDSSSGQVNIHMINGEGFF